MVLLNLEDKEGKVPAGIGSVSSQNVDSVDYFGALSLDEKKEVTNIMNSATKSKSLEDASISLEPGLE